MGSTGFQPVVIGILPMTVRRRGQAIHACGIRSKLAGKDADEDGLEARAPLLKLNGYGLRTPNAFA